MQSYEMYLESIFLKPHFFHIRNQNSLYYHYLLYIENVFIKAMLHHIPIDCSPIIFFRSRFSFAVKSGIFNQEISHQWLSRAICTGSEPTLFDCRLFVSGQIETTKAAAVICTGRYLFICSS